MSPGSVNSDRREPAVTGLPQSGLSRPVHVHTLHPTEDALLPALGAEPRLDVHALVVMPEAKTPSDESRAMKAAWLPSVLIHALLLFFLSQLVTIAPVLPPPSDRIQVVPIELDSLPMATVDGSEAMPQREQLEPVAPVKSPTGTFVSMPPALQPVPPPASARYLAESDLRAERETQAERVVLSPTVVAERFSTQRNAGATAAAQDSAAADQVNEAPKQGSSDGNLSSTGAPAEVAERQASLSSEGERVPSSTAADAPLGRTDGRGRSANLTLFPSSRQLTAILRQGDVGGHGSREGAPDANLLDAQLSDLTRVNARGTPYHAFFSAVRRQFNFYYQQAGANLKAQDVDRRVFEKTYTTRFWVKLEPDGRVGGVQIVMSSGVPAFDGLVMQALRAASPFPEVPQGLLQEEGGLTLGGECRLGIGMGMPTFAPAR